MLRISLTGASGLVGSRIIELLQNDFIFLPISQEQMDITDKNKVTEIINSLDFDIFLHLAAYTNVDSAETNKELAYKINVEGTKNIFEAVQNKNKKFIYISTGFVFDGVNPPYNENSFPNPQSVYAKTKFQGEKIIKKKAKTQNPFICPVIDLMKESGYGDAYIKDSLRVLMAKERIEWNTSARKKPLIKFIK